MQVTREIDFVGNLTYHIPTITEWEEFRQLVTAIANELHGTITQKMESFEVTIWKVVFGNNTVIDFSIDIWLPMMFTTGPTEKEQYHLEKVVQCVRKI